VLKLSPGKVTLPGAKQVWRQFPIEEDIIATRDEPAAVWARVEDCLKAANAPAPLEVIIALDPRRVPDDVEKHFPARNAVRFVRGDEPGGKAATLNAGVRAASGDSIVFTDTSQRFHPDAIRALVDALGHPDVGAVSGYLELPSSKDFTSLAALYWRLERWLRQREAEFCSAVGVTGAIYAVRKALWKPLPPGLLLDDLYTPMQIVLQGYRVGFVASARAWETRQPEPSEEYRRKTRTLTGVLQLCAWLPALLNPARNRIWPQFLLHKLLRFLTPYCALLIAAWGLAAIRPMLMEHWDMWLGPAAAALLCIVVLSADRARRLWNVLAQVLLLQAAVVVATYNGLRGRWDVWGK